MKGENRDVNILFNDSLNLDNYSNTVFSIDADMESEVSGVADSVKNLSTKTKQLSAGFRSKDLKGIESDSQVNLAKITKLKNEVSLKLKELDGAMIKASGNIIKIESRGDYKNKQILDYNLLKQQEATVLRERCLGLLTTLNYAENSLVSLDALLEGVVNSVDRKGLLDQKTAHITKMFLGYSLVQLSCMSVALFSVFYFLINKLTGSLVFYSHGSVLNAAVMIFIWAITLFSLITIMFKPYDDVRYQNVSITQINDRQAYLQLTYYFKDYFKRMTTPYTKASVFLSKLLVVVSVVFTVSSAMGGDSVVSFSPFAFLDYLLPTTFVMSLGLFYFFKMRFSELVINSIEDIADLGFNSSDVKEILEK